MKQRFKKKKKEAMYINSFLWEQKQTKFQKQASSTEWNSKQNWHDCFTSYAIWLTITNQLTNLTSDRKKLWQ